MGDDNFIKLYVCLHNRWNPYSDEVKQLPTHYWLTMFYMLRQQPMLDWKNAFEPQAELIGNLIKPEIYMEYLKIKKRREIADKKIKEGDASGVEVTDKGGLSGYAATTTYFDPDRGIVNTEGKILVPKDKCEEMMGVEGVAITY